MVVMVVVVRDDDDDVMLWTVRSSQCSPAENLESRKVQDIRTNLL